MRPGRNDRLKPFPEWPPTQDEIPDLIAYLRQTIDKADREVEWIRGRIKMVQDICEHPETETGNNMGRWPYTRCKVCGKEW